MQIPPLGLICQCQVDGHTLSSVSLASVGCPDPALLSNIFQVQTSANVDGKDLHPLTCTLGSALSFVTGHPVGAPPRLGRDDFNFLSWIVSASSYIVSVTERNSLDSMVLVWVVPHTQHKRYPCDRNFSKE